MSIVHRRPRPLKRDVTTLRDDRLFIIACDDTYAPKQYFDFFRIPRVQVHVVPTDDNASAAKYVLNRLLRFDHEEDDELWIALDTDHNTRGSHFPGFIATLNEARRHGVKVALSKPCFELWLLLHHAAEAEVKTLSNAAETEAALRTAIGQYNKCLLKSEHFPMASVPLACQRAQALDETVGGGDNPDGNVSRIYLIWKAIAAKSTPAQLPNELKELLA